MSPEARALAQALLDHRKRVCGPRRGMDFNLDACLIPYGELCQHAGISHLKPSVGKFLREIAQWCHENGWPPLNSLAVNHQTRRPGQGYNGAPGCSLEHWLDQARDCIAFDGYPYVISR